MEKYTKGLQEETKIKIREWEKRAISISGMTSLCYIQKLEKKKYFALRKEIIKEIDRIKKGL